jgi:hypothetical protein
MGRAQTLGPALLAEKEVSDQAAQGRVQGPGLGHASTPLAIYVCVYRCTSM